MISIDTIRKKNYRILALGTHVPILQSILDFDFLSGKSKPSLVGVVGNNRTALKLFFGNKEIILPCWSSFSEIPREVADTVGFMLNMQSGRRALASTIEFFTKFPKAVGGHIFAENVPEAHAYDLVHRFPKKLLVGPSGVGLLVPGRLKLGAIGGVDVAQISAGKLMTGGSVAVISTSGGMTNEILRAVVAAGRCVSFAVSLGGDRFPALSVKDALCLAEEDTQTEVILYFGELGGSDEYEIVDALANGKLKKPIHCYVAGVIDDVFEEPMQFGHAKALALHKSESAREKREALTRAGAYSYESFEKFLAAMARLPKGEFSDKVPLMEPFTQRRSSILSTREIHDANHVPKYVKGNKLLPARPFSFGNAIFEALLDRKASKESAAFVENIFELLLDHGGEVSGAVNAMITARAGKDIAASLASGLLTIGPRFGGAVNEAAVQWMEGVAASKEASTYVEEKTRGGKIIAGIGHRVYRVGVPDPRVEALSQFVALLKKHPHYDFARAVEAVTTAKNGKLILNVDGAIAALMLDILAEKDKMSDRELRQLADMEFFNALFIIPRTVGFVGHIMEQKKNDEGLFRLPSELLHVRKKKASQ